MEQQIQESYQTAMKSLGERNVKAARKALRRISAVAPKDYRASHVAAELAFAAGEEDKSVRLFEEAVGGAPEPFQIRLRLAQLLTHVRRRSDAHRIVSDIRDSAGEDHQQWWWAAKLFSRCDDSSSSMDCLARAAELAPQNAGLWYELAGQQFFLGEMDAADASIDKVLALTGPTGTMAGYAWYLRATLKTQTAESNHVQALKEALASGFKDPGGRAGTLYALARELEDMGRHDEAAAALSEGAKLRQGLVQSHVSTELAAMDAITAAWRSMPRPAPATPPGGDDIPIFVIGLPRTGTTLTERILMRDSRVVAAGELFDIPRLVGEMSAVIAQARNISTADASRMIDFAKLGEEYLRGAREAAGGSHIFIDKLPVNFLYVGLIALALPQARIVHLQRNPMDAAWAIHKTLFGSAYLWSGDPAQVADYIVGYTRMMEHWKKLLPDRIMSIRYEDLVSDTETNARLLLDWCSLRDDRATSPDTEEDIRRRMVATASAAQVRQPVHTRSVGKWSHYADLLEPVERRFRNAGLLDS